LQSRQRYPGESCITKGTGKAGKESFNKCKKATAFEEGEKAKYVPPAAVDIV
jgi:hypothetical protein